MKRLSVILICSVVFLCLVQACAALTYEGTLETTPSQVNNLRPGDSVTVTGIIKLPQSGDQTFDMEDILEFSSQLEKPSWTAAIVLDGIENPYNLYGTAPGRKTILGTDLAYPSSKRDVKVSFSVSGAVPSTFSSGTITLVRVLELDSQSNQVGAGVYKNGSVFNPEDLELLVTKKEAELQDLRNIIDENAAIGVDVSAAEKNYTAAKSAIDEAGRKITSTPGDVNRLLSLATIAIESGKTDIQKAWANQAIEEAKTMLGSVDGLITEFTVNNSLKTTDSRLVAIINKRDLAAQAISSANDFFTGSNYPSAHGKAADGLNLANQAWNLSLDLKTELGQGFSLPGLPNLGAFLPVIVVVLIVAVIAGVIIYRKKTQWDELG